jgi:hypothetical protein
MSDDDDYYDDDYDEDWPWLEDANLDISVSISKCGSYQNTASCARTMADDSSLNGIG